MMKDAIITEKPNFHRKGLDTSNLKIEIKPIKKEKRNSKLDRERGLKWEDDLTKLLNDSHRLGDVYNLGGATTYIPDIMIFSNYYTDTDYSKQAKFNVKPVGFEEDIEITETEKFITSQFIMAIECKFTTKEELKITKHDIDKCFEFIQRLGRYDRYVTLAVKFQTSKRKSKQYFIVMRWDKTYIRSDYSYLYINLSGNYYFMNSMGVGRSPQVNGTLNNSFFKQSTQKLVRNSFKIEDI